MIYGLLFVTRSTTGARLKKCPCFFTPTYSTTTRSTRRSTRSTFTSNRLHRDLPDVDAFRPQVCNIRLELL
jgi:hypothetical protein